MQLLPNTHVSPETAYVVGDWPYGSSLRCKKRFWVEFKNKKGFRLVTQTTNPKASFEKWNKPKKSTYSRFGGAMYLDEDGHVQWAGLSEYSDLTESLQFDETYRDAVPEVGLPTLDAWLRAKSEFEYKKSQGLVRWSTTVTGPDGSVKKTTTTLQPEVVV